MVQYSRSYRGGIAVIKMNPTALPNGVRGIDNTPTLWLVLKKSIHMCKIQYTFFPQLMKGPQLEISQLAPFVHPLRLPPNGALQYWYLHPKTACTLLEKKYEYKSAMSTARLDLLKDLEKKAQAKWEAERTFEACAPTDGSKPPKFLVTFPFPYMNGKLHLGHGFSPTKAEFAARFWRIGPSGALAIWLARHWHSHRRLRSKDRQRDG